MKSESNAIEGALKRYVNYLLNRGTDSGVVGVVMLDAKAESINHQILDVLNSEERCQFIALDEFTSAPELLRRRVLVLNAHQSIPDAVSISFEGILRASSFDERGVL